MPISAVVTGGYVRAEGWALRTDRDEFIYRVENGLPVESGLLRAIADLLRRSGAPVKMAYRNQCIAALAQFLVSEGKSVEGARNAAFAYFRGPDDERERRRILSRAACTLRFSVLGDTDTLLLWEVGDRAVEARVLDCLPTTGNSDGLSAISDNGDGTYTLNDPSTDRREMLFSCRVENLSLGIRSVRERLFAVVAEALKPR